MLSETKEAVLLIAALNELAEQTKYGIVDFETYVKEEKKAAASGGSYQNTYADAVVYESRSRRVVLDRIVDEYHDDIVGYYDDILSGVNIHVSAEDEDIWIDVEFDDGSNSTITIENGRWYVSCY